MRYVFGQFRGRIGLPVVGPATWHRTTHPQDSRELGLVQREGRLQLLYLFDHGERRDVA